MKTFTANTEYQMNWICDSDLITIVKVVGISKKSVTIEDLSGPNNLKRCKIHIHNNEEYIFPTGRYSMAPVLKAGKALN